MTKRSCFIHGQYEGEMCAQCQTALPPVRVEAIVGGLIESLAAAIDLIDQYEASRKAQCGTSSVTRNACEYVLRQAKAHTASMSKLSETTAAEMCRKCGDALRRVEQANEDLGG